MNRTRLQMPLRERLIMALDVVDETLALEVVQLLAPRVGYFKVGLELFLAAGFDVVERILDHDCKVMLDLKFYDVPNTVRAAVRQVAGRGASLATVHGDPAIMNAAAEAQGADHGSFGLLAVTALTSLSQEDLKSMGFGGTLEELVLLRGRQARDAGLAGVVCSPREVALLRRELGWGLRIVTPGIRPRNSAQDDQKRTATAEGAIRHGADHIVVGRPIRLARDPLAAATSILQEIEGALER
jgi:orotidine-5'-phosphate decarboxylase